MLGRCLESLHCGELAISRGEDHPVVVVTYGGTPEHKDIVAKAYPKAIHHMIEGDLGCNILWYEAAALAQTRFVVFLPDDDLRPPGFAAEVEKIIDQCESRGAGFGCWPGQAYYWDTGTLGHFIGAGLGASGIHPSFPLIKRLLAPNSYPFSQAAFLYDRETVLDVLSWCEDNLKDCGTRPTMMIGNDIALTLGHIQRFPRMVQSAKCLTWYGHHAGSETLQYAAGNNNLMPMYERARAKLQGVVFPRRKT